jgi:hypothetical protein
MADRGTVADRIYSPRVASIHRIRTKMHADYTSHVRIGCLVVESSLSVCLHVGDTLEIAAQCAIAKADIPAFERALAQLKPYYFDLE